MREDDNLPTGDHGAAKCCKDEQQPATAAGVTDEND